MGVPSTTGLPGRVRRSAVSVAAVGVIIGLAGCGGSSADDQPQNRSEGSSVNAPAVLSKASFSAEVLAAQADASSAHIEATIDLTGESIQLSGDVAGLGSPDDIEMDVAATFGGEQVQLLILDRVFYLKGEEFAPDGKEWLKIDLSDRSNPLAQMFDSANPANFTAYLNGVSAFEDQGAETVDGIETRHYEVTVDTAKMLESNPMFQGQDASTLGLPDEVVTQVYVDADNRPIQLNVDLTSIGSFDVHFSDYGKDVSVTAPDPSTVGKFSF